MSILVLLTSVGIGPGVAADLPIHLIRLSPGFRIDLFAGNVPNARALALSPGGTLFVGSRKAGTVYALPDKDRDFRADRVIPVAGGLNQPNGVAILHGDLYVAEIDRVIRFRRIESRLENPGNPEVVNDRFPDKQWHGWKFIRFGPDGRLYVPVGAPCNVCLMDDPRFAAILRMNPDGTGLEIFTRGVRNTVGFDWHPITGELWFTDNGRDWLGDDQPPDELNHAPKAGLHFGFPYVHGRSVRDPVYWAHRGFLRLTPPARELGPHVAALGMRFYTGKSFPESYRNNIFIAEHGSWNRSEPIGYRIMRVKIRDRRPPTYEVFARGWLQGEQAWGRPVDIEIMPDGSMLVSDDHAGAVYRIHYTGEQ